MPIVVNATQEKITLQLQGNYFTWEPGKEKVIHNESLARFIETNRPESGLAVLPDVMGGEESLSTEEYAERMKEHNERKKEACELALNRYIEGLRKVIYNNQVSLRRDLEQANIKASPESFASEGELEAMRLVAKYKRSEDDKAAKRVEEAKKLMETINKGK